MQKADIASYADNNTPYVTAEILATVKRTLEKDRWFSGNQFQANLGVYVTLLSVKNNRHH